MRTSMSRRPCVCALHMDHPRAGSWMCPNGVTARLPRRRHSRSDADPAGSWRESLSPSRGKEGLQALESSILNHSPVAHCLPSPPGASSPFPRTSPLSGPASSHRRPLHRSPQAQPCSLPFRSWIFLALCSRVIPRDPRDPGDPKALAGSAVNCSVRQHELPYPRGGMPLPVSGLRGRACTHGLRGSSRDGDREQCSAGK